MALFASGRSLLVFSLRFAFGFVPAFASLAACLTQLTVGLLCRLTSLLGNPVRKLSGLSRRRISVFVIAGASSYANRKENQHNCRPKAHDTYNRVRCAELTNVSPAMPRQEAVRRNEASAGI